MGRRATASLGVCVLLLLALLPPTPCRAVEAAPPKPQTVAFSENWDGIDGSWNTVPIRIGTPPQVVRGVVSTASQQTWAVFEQACLSNRTDRATNKAVEALDQACNESRGRTLDVTGSSSWQQIGFYALWLEKDQLNLTGIGKYGYDQVGLGYTEGDGPTLANATVGALITDNFWLGHFGLNPKPTNFSAFNDPSPSYLSQLFEGSRIPSLAWGYTAGAHYHFDSVPGSLTLGGYDSARFVPNDLTFGFAPDNERDIVVGVVGIHANSPTKQNYDLMQYRTGELTMYIDSTVAELYLPLEVCDAFEHAFGLKYDEKTDLYLVDEDLHKNLLADNASVTFTIGQKFSSDSTVDIVLPYAALDHMVKPPYKGVGAETRYFPIRRAVIDNSFILGRAFLQEAYLIVDWERQNFSVSQCSWVYPQATNIVSILSRKYTGEDPGEDPGDHGSRLGKGAIVGIAVAGGVSIAMTLFIIAWCFRRKRQKSKHQIEDAYASQAAAIAKALPFDKNEEIPTSPINEEEGTNVFPKAELPAESARPELSSDTKSGNLGSPHPPNPTNQMFEADNTERQIFEMMGDIPTRQEADGRQLSEKESMVVRERLYNGVDPMAPPPMSPVSPASEEPPRRPLPIYSSEVAMVNPRLPNVSPTTPRTPRDGASLEAGDTFFQVLSRTPRDGRHLETEDFLLSPISPLEDTPRRRFSFEGQ